MSRRLAAVAVLVIVLSGCGALELDIPLDGLVESEGSPSSRSSHQQETVPDYASYPAQPVARRPNARPDEDLDCKDFSGPVYIGEIDPNDLDRDADGVGCE